MNKLLYLFVFMNSICFNTTAETTQFDKMEKNINIGITNTNDMLKKNQLNNFNNDISQEVDTNFHFSLLPDSTITDHDITLISPDGGETWIVDTTQAIAWQTIGVNTIKLDYSIDGGVTWVNIVETIDARNGFYSWKIPYISSSLCYIRASDATNPGVFDKVAFSICSNVKLVWKYQTLSSINSSPSIGKDGTVYIGSKDRYLYAIQPDGVLKWKFQTSHEIDSSSPSVGNDGAIYIVSKDGNLYAIHPEGSLLWKTLSCASSPAIGKDETIYTMYNQGFLYASTITDSVKWCYPIYDNVLSSPVIGSDGTIYIGTFEEVSSDNFLYAINPYGSLKWKYHIGSAMGSSPAIGGDGTVYVGSINGCLYAINPDGSLKWSFQTGGKIYLSSPSIDMEGTIYIGSWDNHLYAIHSDGSLKWKYEASTEIDSSPTIGIDGTVYFGTYNGYLYAINPDGSLKWKYKTGFSLVSSPAIGDDGTIYIGSSDGCLYSISSGAVGGLASSPWPKWQHDNHNSGRLNGSTSLIPPSHLTVTNIPSTQGESWMLTWDASPSETSGSVLYYRIYRSLINTMSDSIKSINQFANSNDISAWERHAIVMIDSVTAGQNEYNDNRSIIPEEQYYYWIQAVGINAVSIKVSSHIPTGVEERIPSQNTFTLGEAYPNPFNSFTTIEYSISQNTHVLLQVYNIAGQRIATLSNGNMPAGRHSVIWNAHNIPSGVYFLNLKISDHYSSTKKILLLK